MILRANQTVHVSSVGADPIRDGEIFEINDNEGAQLVKLGHASEVKAESAPENKMEAAPANKAATKRKAK